MRYHPTRDQLIVSSGSDGGVCLYGLPSLSSEAPRVDPGHRQPTGAAAATDSHSGSDISLDQ